MPPSEPLSERIYRRLVRCLPLDFRVDHQEEMEQFFRLERRQAARGGGRRFLGLWLRALVDLARGAVREHADAFVQDARLTWRSALRRRGFTLAVVATLALALGANAAMFGVVHTVLLRPLPFADEGRLVRLYDVRTLPDGSQSRISFSRRNLDAVARQAATITSVTGQVYQGPALRVGNGPAERVTAIGVSGTWFQTLGLAPALASRSPDLKSVLQEGGDRSTARGHRLLGGLVVAEVAQSVLLVLGAGLMASSLYRLFHRDLGFDPEGLLTVGISLPESEYGEPGPRERVIHEIALRVGALPGVSEAAVINLFPFADGNFLASFRLEGEALGPDQAHSASYRLVSFRREPCASSGRARP